MKKYLFGKKAPQLDYRTLMFTNYLTPEIAPPPPAFDNLSIVYAKTGVLNPTILFPMDGNDTLGDCTIAGVAHAKTCYKGRIGVKDIPAEKDVIKTYKRLCGCNGDNGLAELDVLKKLRKKGLLGEKIYAYAKITDIKNHTHLKQAIQLFGGLYIGFNVQEDAVQDFTNNVPWTPGPLLNEGHAVFVTSYNKDYVTVLTWGNKQLATWNWVDETWDEAYIILPLEAQDPTFCPGYNFQQLETDLTIVTK